jgi:hypothetical protein
MDTHQRSILCSCGWFQLMQQQGKRRLMKIQPEITLSILRMVGQEPCNGSMAAANAGLTETEIQAMDKSGVGGGNGNGSGSGNDTYVRRLAPNMTP